MSLEKLLKDDWIRNQLPIPCVYPGNYIVHHEHETCDTIGIILEGSIEMLHHSVDGERLKLAQLDAPAIYGDFLIFSGNPYYPGDLVVRNKARVIHVPKTLLDRLLSQSMTFRSFYLENLSDKALAFNMDNKMLRQRSIEEKILFLLENAHARGKENSYSFESQARLAEIINVRRPSLSRELSRLRTEGKIDYDRRRLWLPA